MSTTFDSVFINNISLRPAPYVSTTYEYNKSGEYIIGGLLILTLSGTIVNEDMSTKIEELQSLQTNSNCVSVVIGCSGEKQFLDGSGRIRSVTIDSSDQPYIISYSIQLAIEYLNGKPAVSTDNDFFTQTCLPKNNIRGGEKIYIEFLQNYTETISIVGEGDVIASTDTGRGSLLVSKSYIKANGRITLTSFDREICGVPDYNGKQNSLSIINLRANDLLNMTMCNSNHPLSQFNGWNKWIDTQSLSIDANGTITWSFDMYLSKGSATPYAWVDINVERTDYRKAFVGSGFAKKEPSRKISGTIKGLSASNAEFLVVASDNDKLSNAKKAFDTLDNTIINGSWDDVETILNSSTNNGQCLLDPCTTQEPATCLQRISSNYKESLISGEISFAAEYGPINACKSTGAGNIEITIEDQKSSQRYVEYVIPGAGRVSIIPLDADTPRRVTITGRGTLNGCDTTQMSQVISCVQTAVQLEKNKYGGTWIIVDNKKTVGTYSYSESWTYLQCQG